MQDRDGDGSVSFDEFLHYVGKLGMPNIAEVGSQTLNTVAVACSISKHGLDLGTGGTGCQGHSGEEAGP